MNQWITLKTFKNYCSQIHRMHARFIHMADNNYSSGGLLDELGKRIVFIIFSKHPPILMIWCYTHTHTKVTCSNKVRRHWISKVTQVSLLTRFSEVLFCECDLHNCIWGTLQEEPTCLGNAGQGKCNFPVSSLYGWGKGSKIVLYPNFVVAA